MREGRADILGRKFLRVRRDTARQEQNIVAGVVEERGSGLACARAGEELKELTMVTPCTLKLDELIPRPTEVETGDGSIADEVVGKKDMEGVTEEVAETRVLQGDEGLEQRVVRHDGDGGEETDRREMVQHLPGGRARECSTLGGGCVPLGLPGVGGGEQAGAGAGTAHGVSR